MFGSRGLRPVIPPYVPEVLSILMQRCWHKDPNSRPEFNEVIEVNFLLSKKSASEPVLFRIATLITVGLSDNAEWLLPLFLYRCFLSCVLLYSQYPTCCPVFSKVCFSLNKHLAEYWKLEQVLRTLEMLVVTPPSSRRVVSRRRTTNTSFRSGIPQVNSWSWLICITWKVQEPTNFVNVYSYGLHTCNP